MQERTGTIFGIQHFSIDDGPGIRTTAFLKGCNLSCVWCHNPESYSPDIELMYWESRCILCGACEQVCPKSVHSTVDGTHRIDRSRCIMCGECVKACPHQALTLTGWQITPSAVIEEAKRDLRYYKESGGGLTLSGGEPLCQSAFSVEIARLAKRAGISVAIETNGSMSFSGYAEILPYTDLFLIDYKLTDKEAYQKLTGADKQTVLNTIEKLDAAGADMVLRCPIIPDVNDNTCHFSAIAKLTTQYQHVLGFELMPYHKYGTAKADRLDRDMPVFREPEEDEVAGWKAEIIKNGGLEWGGTR